MPKPRLPRGWPDLVLEPRTITPSLLKQSKTANLTIPDNTRRERERESCIANADLLLAPCSKENSPPSSGLLVDLS